MQPHRPCAERELIRARSPRSKSLDKVLVRRQFFLFLGRQGIQVDLFVGHHPSPLHHRLADKDRRLDAHGQGNGIAGPRIQLDPLPIPIHDDAGIKSIVVQVVDQDVRHRGTKLGNGLLHEVVGQRPGDLDP